MKKSILFSFLFFLFIQYTIHADPPANKGYVLVFNESFLGDSLNTGNWIYRVGRRTGTSINGLNLQANVYVKDSALHIVAKHEMINGVYENTGGGIISKNDFGYGYYECLSKPFMAGTGVHSAFWQRGSNVTGSTVFEIDSYEIDSKYLMATNNLYYLITQNGYSEYPWPHRANIPFTLDASGWFLDAYERTPDGIVFYDNGKVVAKADWPSMNAGQSVWLTALNGVGTVDAGKLPGESVFKYFRFYAKDYPGYNLIANGGFEFNQDKINASKPVSWNVSGTSDAVVVSAISAFKDRYKLQLSKPTAFQTALNQSLSYINNGHYELSAMVRSSGGLTIARLTASGFGGADVNADIPATSEWTKIKIPVDVENNSVNVTFKVAGTGGQWVEIDDVTFLKPLENGAVLPVDTPVVRVGQPIWTAAESEPVRFTGDSKFYFFDRNVGYGDSISIAFTVSAAIKANMTPIARIPSSGNAGWAVQLNEDRSLTFRIGSVANHTDVTVANAFTVGESANIVCVYCKGTASVYVNAVLLKTVSGITQTTTESATAGRMGTVGASFQAVGDVVLPDSTIINTNNSMKNFAGTLRHVRIYNRAIQPSEFVNEPSSILTPELPGGNDKWKLKWHDEFDYQDAMLDENWNSQNSAEPGLLSSRWRENAVVSNGTLKLLNKNETRAGQSRTSGNISSKLTFGYGYYECRYKYAPATGINNMFGLLSESDTSGSGKMFGIDINNGHYPSEINTSVHDLSDIAFDTDTGEQFHPASPKSFNFSPDPDVKIQFEKPVKTRKVRLISDYPVHFHIQEFRIYNVNPAGYPNVLSATADNDVAGLINFARDPLTTITSSGVFASGYEAKLAADGGLTRHWVSQDNGRKWIEFDFPSDKTIGCIQFISGWVSGGVYNSIINDYSVSYFDGTNWVDIQSFNNTAVSADFSNTYHFYGLNRTADSLTFYHDGNLIRSLKNDYAKANASVFLSTGITEWAGKVTDAINGTQMEVDYVRIYEPAVTGFIAPVPKQQPSVNAFNHHISVTVPDSRLMSVYNINGSLVLTRNLNSGFQSIPFADDGLFFVRLQNRSDVFVSKIIMK